MRQHVSTIVACLLLAAVAAATPARAEANINFILGTKYLDQDDWGDADEQGEFGVLSTFGPSDWPVSVAIDALFTGREDDVLVTSPVVTQIELLQATWELDVGVRKIWKPGKARPFVGGGLAVIGAGRELSVGLLVVDESDTAPGVWIDGGVFWRLGKRFNIGLEARASRATVDLFQGDVEAGGFHLGLLLGWGWGD